MAEPVSLVAKKNTKVLEKLDLSFFPSFPRQRWGGATRKNTNEASWDCRSRRCIASMPRRIWARSVATDAYRRAAGEAELSVSQEGARVPPAEICSLGQLGCFSIFSLHNSRICSLDQLGCSVRPFTTRRRDCLKTTTRGGVLDFRQPTYLPTYP